MPPTSFRLAHKPSKKFNINKYLSAREVGLKCPAGLSNEIAGHLYCHLDRFISTGHSLGIKDGGIFNLEFNSNGTVLIAACENKCVLIFDANNQKLQHTMENAHDSCVNCVRFLDDRLFATCSDDTTIKLWDIRTLKTAYKTLHGHSNWVKNIEFSPKDNLMVSSAFDGSIFTWDLKNPTENSMVYDKIFLLNGLMRMKLTPDGTKMLISTTSGYIIIIHDLSLPNLTDDLRAFKPQVYRLMQSSGQCFPAGAVYNYLFLPSRSRNRVEFIDDFSLDAEVISSMQIHPHGWNVVSRCVNSRETQEATNVHDIQKRNEVEYEECVKYIDEEEGQDATSSADVQNAHRTLPADLWLGYMSNRQYLSERNVQFIGGVFPTENMSMPLMGTITSGLIGGSNYREYFNRHPDEKNKLILNLPRLTHYIPEKNVGTGFIKELCFSPDGRLICSPYDKGVRLLGFNSDYQELTYCVPDKPQKLKNLVELSDYHKQIVVSCQFRPNDYSFVSGCLNGEIVWYKPIL